MVLLERDDLLDELGSLRAEGGRLVFVGGEAGVGKTALVRAFAQRVGGVRRGSCENLAAPAPLGPFLDIGLEPGDSRRVAAAALELDVVAVLEDVHWADAASLDVLRVLGRRIDGTDAFVLATCCTPRSRRATDGWRRTARRARGGCSVSDRPRCARRPMALLICGRSTISVCGA